VRKAVNGESIILQLLNDGKTKEQIKTELDVIIATLAPPPPIQIIP
jgi:hypothetical protein